VDSARFSVVTSGKKEFGIAKLEFEVARVENNSVIDNVDINLR